MTDSVKRLDGFTVMATDLVARVPLSGVYIYLIVAAQAIVDGFSMVRYSRKFCPTLPSAKYHVVFTGVVGAADGVLFVGVVANPFNIFPALLWISASACGETLGAASAFRTAKKINGVAIIARLSREKMAHFLEIFGTVV